MCSVMFTDTYERVAYFRVCHRLLDVQYDRIWMRKENIIETAQCSQRLRTRSVSALFHAPSVAVWETLTQWTVSITCPGNSPS